VTLKLTIIEIKGCVFMDSEEVLRLLYLEKWEPKDESIAINLNEKERMFLAEHMEKYDGIIIDYSCDRSERVRGAAATNKNLPINILEKMSNSDNSTDVRKKAEQTLKEIKL